VAKVYKGIGAGMAAWIAQQPVFFVATAPLAADGLVNLSPKGAMGTFRVADAHTFSYLDITGSGIETVAHLRENGRVCVMFCSFDRRPTIVQVADRLLQPVALHQLAHGGRLAAGDHQPVEAVQLGRPAHLHALQADVVQGPQVLAERPLEGENSDPTSHASGAARPRRGCRSRCPPSARRGRSRPQPARSGR